MKRFVIAVLILLGMIGASVYSLFVIGSFRSVAVPLLTATLEQAESGSIKDATALAFEFQEVWNQRQASMIAFARHEPLDRIACLAARLPYLGKYDDPAQFVAEINELLAAISILWDNELPALQNLL